MLFGKGKPRTLGARRRGAYLPRGEDLESRALLSTIDFGTTSPPTLPQIATTPYGVLLAGPGAPAGAGHSVAAVGDINGDGFDDYVIGAPTAAQLTAGGQPVLGNGNGSAAYLIFGSKQAGGGNFNWASLDTMGQRVADLSQLGNAANVTNPTTVNGQTAFPYDGIRFIASQQGLSFLGESVAPVPGGINGTPAFLIGAPGAMDINNQNPGTGRAYLVYGTGLNSLTTHQIDLDSLPSGVTIVTFENVASGQGTGTSVAAVGNVLGDGGNDIAIGAPTATVGGQAGVGAVYVIPASAIPRANTVVDLSRVGQTGGIPGVTFIGESASDRFGWSIAGSVRDLKLAASNNPQGVSDLLVGAPGIRNNAGAAYLVYGGVNLNSLPQNVGGGTLAISMTAVGDTAAGQTVPGARFYGFAAGNQTGFSVSTANDFNNDGFPDIQIGSPGVNVGSAGGAGEATVIYSGPSGAPLGIYTMPTPGVSPFFPMRTDGVAVRAANFLGEAAGAMTGYSVGFTGPLIAADATPRLLVGAPGLNNNQGAAYVIPSAVPPSNTLGVPNKLGDISLAQAILPAPTGDTLRITLSTPAGVPALTPPFFGASVSGKLNLPGQGATADSDLIPDFIVGAPGYAPNSSRGLAGGGFVAEGVFLRNTITPTPTATLTPMPGGRPVHRPRPRHPSRQPVHRPRPRHPSRQPVHRHQPRHPSRQPVHRAHAHKLPVIRTNRRHERLSPTTPLGGQLP